MNPPFARKQRQQDIRMDILRTLEWTHLAHTTTVMITFLDYTNTSVHHLDMALEAYLDAIRRIPKLHRRYTVIQGYSKVHGEEDCVAFCNTGNSIMNVRAYGVVAANADRSVAT